MRVVILGAGISGHTAALILRKKLPREHKVTVVSPNSRWNWIPSNIWVGIGRMKAEDVTFDLAPIYAKQGIEFIQAKALEIHPDGSVQSAKPFVTVESTAPASKGTPQDVEYDYLVNATGPKLKFEATPGLGPEGHSLSVCTYQHALETARRLDEVVEEMKKGHKKTFVIGMGHGACTCEGAAFEYVFNLEFELRQRGVRDKAQLIFLTNEAELGDFGVDGMQLKANGHITPGHIFAESLFVERGVDWILGAHVRHVDEKNLEYESLDGSVQSLDFDFAMLLPPFSGVGMKAFDKEGKDITSDLFSPNQFMKVDANYEQKPYEKWLPSDWPTTYQTKYPNVFAIGIAFAPPHAISRPRTAPSGASISPAPPRTGMPSAIMGRTVARTIIDMIKTGSRTPTHGSSMADMGAACVASAGASPLRGSAAAITMFPIIPDFEKYPGVGRSTSYTTGEIGLAGHWIKILLHYAFIYKAKAKPFWWVIPE